MFVRFLAGLTKYQSQDDIEVVLAFQKKGERELLDILHWLFEAHDPGLVQKCMSHREGTLELERKLWIHLTVMFLVTLLPATDSQ